MGEREESVATSTLRQQYSGASICIYLEDKHHLDDFVRVTRRHSHRSGFLLKISVCDRLEDQTGVVVRDTYIYSSTSFVERDEFLSGGITCLLSPGLRFARVSDQYHQVVYNTIATFARVISDFPHNRYRHVIVLQVLICNVRPAIARHNYHGHDDNQTLGSAAATLLMTSVRLAEGSSAAEEQCAICIEELSSRVEVVGLPCSHLFHQDCILEWLKQKPVCPLCRSAWAVYSDGHAADVLTFPSTL